MNEATHIIDAEGEVIIILQCPDYTFAFWNDEAEPEPLKPHADEREIDASNDAAHEETRKITASKKKKKKQKNKKRRLAPSDIGEPAAEPTVESAPFDEQIEGACSDASVNGLIEDECEKDSEVILQRFGSDEHMEENCFRIQVSAKHLTLSSPVFKKTLTSSWKEGFLLLKKGSVEITVSGWDLEAFLILMNIFHCRPQNLPREISLELLAKVAILADYYECQTLVQFFADKWIDTLRGSFPIIYPHDSMLWVWVSWAFGLLLDFNKSTSIAISQSNNLITNLGLPIPAKVIDEMNNRRHNAISNILSSLTEQRDAFLDGSRGCSFECSSIMFGALTKHMRSSALYSPQPTVPFPGLSYHGLIETVRAFKSPQWSAYSGYSSYSNGHACGESSFSSLVNVPVDDVEGLGLTALAFPYSR